jgi:predicted Zn-dependent protease
MQDYFHTLADDLQSLARAGEVLTAWFSAERSDFIRFNQSAVRQPTHVQQAKLTISLIVGQRRATRLQTLSFDREADRQAVRANVERLRGDIPDTPDDPYLLFNREPVHSERRQTSALPEAQQVIEETIGAAAGKDLVGLYAGGPIYRGFANSLGQRNWHELAEFQFGWCRYLERDKAVRTQYAGTQWDSAVFAAKMAQASGQLARLAHPARELAPGGYRVYFAPPAVGELIGMLAWDGFGTKNVRTKQSTLQALYEGQASLHPEVFLSENVAGSSAPDFQPDGFVKPHSVPLVQAGQAAQSLTSPRSAREYGIAANGAGEGEAPEALSLEPGTLAEPDVLAALDTGLYVGNLWYLNYSDRQHCRMTGMTRFACFWVENGAIQAPLNVMRFDDSAYRFLGSELQALTAEAMWMPDEDSYGERAVGGMRAPGLLVKDFRFTL